MDKHMLDKHVSRAHGGGTQGYCSLETPGEGQGGQSNEGDLPGSGRAERLEHSGSTREVRPQDQSLSRCCGTGRLGLRPAEKG